MRPLFWREIPLRAFVPLQLSSHLLPYFSLSEMICFSYPLPRFYSPKPELSVLFPRSAYHHIAVFQETPLGIENHKTLSALIFLCSVHVWMGLSLFFWGREKNTSLGLAGKQFISLNLKTESTRSEQTLSSFTLFFCRIFCFP